MPKHLHGRLVLKMVYVILYESSTSEVTRKPYHFIVLGAVYQIRIALASRSTPMIDDVRIDKTTKTGSV